MKHNLHSRRDMDMERECKLFYDIITIILLLVITNP